MQISFIDLKNLVEDTNYKKVHLQPLQFYKLPLDYDQAEK